MVAELTERRQLILKLVVQEFIERATPVASETLVRKHDLSVSPATVRSELAALEELGYLTHLHTSAGRVPTDNGYRFFVENLMECVPLLPEEQQAIRQEIYEVRSDMDNWVQIAARVLARKAQNASVVTPPRVYQSRFKHLELVAMSDTLTLMVLILHGGTVRQQILALETRLAQEELSQVSAHISNRCADATAERIEEILAQDRQQQGAGGDPFRRTILELVLSSMHQFEDEINQRVHSDGLLEMLSQPEFLPTLMKEEDSHRAIERMRHMLEVISSSKVLGTLILQALANDEVQVIIGEEHSLEEMRNYSVILSRYGVDGAATGVVGVIGPTRMSYPRSISTVRYLSLVMSNVLSELYGNETLPSVA